MASMVDFVNDFELAKAYENAQGWKASAEEWQAHAEDMERCNAQNLAMRHALADQLRAVDPTNPFLVDAILVDRLRDTAMRVFAFNKNFDDVRRMANRAAGRTEVNRESFVRNAYNTLVLGVLKERLIDYGPEGKDYILAKYREELPSLILSNLLGDDENVVLSPKYRAWFHWFAGDEYDKLLASGKLEKDPSKSPTQQAIELGERMVLSIELKLDDTALFLKNHRRGHYPPEDLARDGPKPPKPAPNENAPL